MKGFWWRMPVPSRRMSSFQRGFATAAAFIGSGSLGLVVFDGSITSKLRQEALSDVAQIGATLLVAYAVETSWLVKRIRGRGRNRENFVGVTCSTNGVMR